jgi:hypothetical protein
VPLFLAEPLHGLNHLEGICEIFSVKLAWSETEIQTQKDQLFTFIERELAWKKEL